MEEFEMRKATLPCNRRRRSSKPQPAPKRTDLREAAIAADPELKALVEEAEKTYCKKQFPHVARIIFPEE